MAVMRKPRSGMRVFETWDGRTELASAKRRWAEWLSGWSTWYTAAQYQGSKTVLDRLTDNKRKPGRRRFTNGSPGGRR